jgi:hypothetical protein
VLLEHSGLLRRSVGLLAMTLMPRLIVNRPNSALRLSPHPQRPRRD